MSHYCVCARNLINNTHLFTDTSAFLISIALSCCFSVILVAMGIKFPWFRRQMRLGSMAQMTATVNANAKKETTARVANVPSQGVFKRWDDVESGPPPEPTRVALRKDKAPAPPPPPAARSTSLPPASRRNNAEALGRRSEVPPRPERSSAKETSEAKKERKLDEAKRKEEKRQDSIRKKADEKRKLKGDKRRGEAVSVTVVNQQPPPRIQVGDEPGPSGVQPPPAPPRVEPPAERTIAEPPSEALVVSGTEVKGKTKDKDKKKKKKKEALLVAPPSSRNPNAEGFKKPTNPMARRPSAPPTALNAVIFQKMNGVQKPSSPESSRTTLAPPPPAELIAPRSPRPAVKSQARPRLLTKKKAPLGKAVAPPRIYTPPSTPPPSYEASDSTPREAAPLKGITFESDGFLSFRLPEAPEPLEVHPAFFALSGGDESDECDA